MDTFKDAHPDLNLDEYRIAYREDVGPGLRETCPDCGGEFIYTMAGSDPPRVLTECDCGEWLIVMTNDEEMHEFLGL